MMEEGVGSSSQLCNEGQICEMPFPGFCLHQEFVSIFVMSFSLAPEQVVPYCRKCDKLNPELYQIDCCYCAGAEAFWEEKKKKRQERYLCFKFQVLCSELCNSGACWLHVQKAPRNADENTGQDAECLLARQGLAPHPADKQLCLSFKLVAMPLVSCTIDKKYGSYHFAPNILGATQPEMLFVVVLCVVFFFLPFSCLDLKLWQSTNTAFIQRLFHRS